jgi:hypothetical protein
MSRSDNPGTSETDPADLLIRLLKLSSFVSGPMRDGVCDPAGIAPAELRIVMALAGEGALAGHDLVEITGLQPMNVSRAMAQLRGRGWIEEACSLCEDPARFRGGREHAFGRTEPERAQQARDPLRQGQRAANRLDPLAPRRSEALGQRA